MPSILRGIHWEQQEDSVAIPDWELPLEQLPEVESEENEEQDFQEAQEFIEQLPAIDSVEPEPEPEPLTEDELRELYRPQWEQMRTIAEQRAYTDTATEYRGRLEQCIQQMDDHLQEMDRLHQSFIEQYAVELKHLAVDIAEKWVCTRLENEDELLESLVMQSISKVKDAKWMKIELSDQMVQLSETIQGELDRSEFAGKAQTTTGNNSIDTCVIHTNAGELDASIHTQADNTRKAFTAIDQSEG